MKRSIGLVALASLLSIFVMPSPASASTVWKIGTQGQPDILSSTASAESDGCRDGNTYLDASVLLYVHGDVLWVRDQCRDGLSAVGVVEWAGGSERRICRNPHGVNTYAKCDWDWPESPTKLLMAGTVDGSSTQIDVDYWASVSFAG